MKYGYIRVSTEKQDYYRQQYALEEYGVDKCNIFEEKISGTKRAISRLEFEKMVSKLESGDTCVFESMSRMARSMQDLIDTTNFLVKNKKVIVIFIKENITIGSNSKDNAMNSLIFNVMGAFAQFERDLISDRTKQGISARKEILGDKFKIGREKTFIPQEKIELILKLYSQLNNISEVSRETKISRRIVDRVIKEN